MATPGQQYEDREAKAPKGVNRASPDERSTRLTRWTSVLYLLLVLAAPALVHWGPDVLSPAAPMIADAARDGRLALPAHPLCAAAKTFAATRSAVRRAC